MRVCSSSFLLIRDPVSVPVSRQRLGRLLKQWGVRTDADSRMALETVISELVTNAVRHTTGAMLTVGVHANLDLRRLIIEVYDGSQALPHHQVPGPEAETGRGMFLVERLALAHGANQTTRGKKVWAEVALPDQPLTRRQLLTHPRRAARALARRLSGSRRQPMAALLTTA
ncbi:ATP-binding protein [Kitasatospora sp. NPDC050463]|uniref:ATP-binding protein n=1 Tax=Kitasatospora sp. NPDC050463 TaxID=3155786 RepID=UPI003400BB41